MQLPQTWKEEKHPLLTKNEDIQSQLLPFQLITYLYFTHKKYIENI